MASKIQVRRGQKSELPALSSGELGLCEDSKELFIGVGGENEPVNAVFSETPVKIGTWINGKAIYRKCGLRTYSDKSKLPASGFNGDGGFMSQVSYLTSSGLIREDYFVYHIIDEGTHFADFKNALEFAKTLSGEINVLFVAEYIAL